MNQGEEGAVVSKREQEMSEIIATDAQRKHAPRNAPLWPGAPGRKTVCAAGHVRDNSPISACLSRYCYRSYSVRSLYGLVESPCVLGAWRDAWIKLEPF